MSMAFSFERLLDLPDSVRRAVSLVVAMGHNRLELFSLECREEFSFSLKVLLVVLAAFFLAMFGVLLVTVVFVYALPPGYRLLGMAGCALAYLFGALVCALWARSLFTRHPVPFAQTLAEFRKDKAGLGEP